MDFDIQKLVSETIDYNKVDLKDFETSFLANSISKIPESSGILYHVEQTSGTFVIRTLVSDNLQLDFQKVANNPENFPKLRLENDEEELDKLQFFETDNIQIARSITSQLSNKRYPKFEENVINVSDPGDSWYLGYSGNEFKVFFNLSRTHNLESLVKLGPLGDVKETTQLLGQLSPYFSKFFNVTKYSTNKASFSMTADQENIYLDEFANIFKFGEIGPFLFQKFIELERQAPNEQVLKSFQKVNSFFMYLASTRSFWKKVECSLA